MLAEAEIKVSDNHDENVLFTYKIVNSHGIIFFEFIRPITRKGDG